MKRSVKVPKRFNADTSTAGSGGPLFVCAMPRSWRIVVETTRKPARRKRR